MAANEGTAEYTARKNLLESHLARLADARTDVSRSKVRTPWLWLGLLFVIPAGLHWGSIGALGAFLTTIAITTMGYYVTWAHQQEYASQEDAVRAQLRELDHALAHGPRERSRWRVEGKRTQL